MASEAYMRDKLKEAYPGFEWAYKVDQMSKEQVLAIYYRLLEQNVIKVKGEKSETTGTQLRLDI